MKDVEFAKRWRRPVNETTVEEYSAGSKLSVSAETAKAAFDAGVLKGEPVDTPPSVETPAETKKKA